MALRDWAPRVLAADDTNPTKTIQLSADGTIWETWTAPFPDGAEFISTAEAVIAAFAEECPKRRIPLLFTAVAGDGAIKSQCPGSVQGKNAQADALAGSGNGAAKAFADAMTGITAVMNATLKAAQQMVENVTAANTALTQQIVDQQEYIKAKQDAEIVEKQADSGMNAFFVEQLKSASPLALEALDLFLQSQKKTPAATIAKAAVTGINQVTNGAS